MIPEVDCGKCFDLKIKIELAFFTQHDDYSYCLADRFPIYCMAIGQRA